MLNIVTVNWQNYQGRGAEYTNNLFDMVRRNLEEGAVGKFICFTDDPDAGYAKGIETRPLPTNLIGWFQKLYLFKDGVFPYGDRIVYFDLDSLITGSLDKLAAYGGKLSGQGEDFAVLRDFYRGGDALQSSAMTWRAGCHTHIWDAFAAAGFPQTDPGGDQAFIEKHATRVRRLQDIFPDMFVSYKMSGGVLPQKASVCVFHGEPRPHTITQGWVPRVWREGGISHAELKAVCNTADEALMANVKSACRRDLDWFQPADEHDGHVAIIGGGPSLVDMIDEIKWRQSIGQTVWVLNNAHKALQGTGIRYDAQVLLDARPETAGFITGAIKYLVASQCDPAVFNVLCNQRVTLWHANTPQTADFLKDEPTRPAYLVGGGTTVGMNAMALAMLKGFRKVHLYGFDSSYRDGAHHAYPQTLNDTEKASETLYGDKTYFCAPWMISQAREFLELVPGYMDDGAIVTVHGSGLLPDIGLGMLGVRSPAQQRADQVLARVPAGAVGVEVGVFAGQMSAALLRGTDVRLIMVDSWEGAGAAYTGDSGDWHATLTDASQENFMEQAKQRVKFAADRAYILRMRSGEAATGQVNASVDFVFLDADHSYEGCKRDLERWAPKVRPGGWLCGHDYENTDFPKFGVTRAVNEFVARTGLTLELGENFCWFVRMPVC